MKIFINKPRPFEAGVIVRTLHCATNFHDIVVYIEGLRNIDSFVKYSRVPVRKIIEKIKFHKPKNLGNYVVIDPKSDKTVGDIDWSKVETIVIDFSGEINGTKVRGLGLDLLHYESISVLYYIFIKRRKWEINERVVQNIDRDLIYVAKKLLEGIVWFDNYYLIYPRIIAYTLKHLHKRYGLLVDYRDVNVKIDPIEGKLRMSFILEFYTKKLEKVHESIVTLEDNVLEIPIYRNRKEKRYKLVFDWDRRRVYLSGNSYLELEEREETGLENLSFL